MIVDSHAYCFEPADSARGYKSADHHLAIVQQAQARHHQPAFRVRDGVEGLSHVLDSASGRLEDIPDVNFRIDGNTGRVLWDHDGETYTKHFYPPNLHNLEFSAHSLIGEMDYAGIDHVLLHTNNMLGRDNRYQAECVQRYPDRILSMSYLDEHDIHGNVDTAISMITQAIRDLSLHAIKFSSYGYDISPEPWDGGVYEPFWDAVSQLGVPIFFTLCTGPERGLETEPDAARQKGYLRELEILARLMEKYPAMFCSITHGFPWRIFLDGDGISLPDDIWNPFQNPKLSVEICFPVRIGDHFDYPYKEIWPTFEAMLEHIGPAQLMYGTDMPFQNRFCTYRQSRHWIERHFAQAVGMSNSDLALIMGGCAARVLGIGVK